MNLLIINIVNKLLILKFGIYVNLLFLFLFILSFFIYNCNYSTYFRVGWSKNFVFISIAINTPLRYFLLCLYITILNITEIFLNEISFPIIQFSTYNPYYKNIRDFSRFDLEYFSNLIFFIQGLKRLLQMVITLSQIDIAFISLLSSQGAAFFAIRYLLNNKNFNNDISDNISINNRYVEINYDSINENTNIFSNV